MGGRPKNTGSTEGRNQHQNRKSRGGPEAGENEEYTNRPKDSAPKRQKFDHFGWGNVGEDTMTDGGVATTATATAEIRRFPTSKGGLFGGGNIGDEGTPATGFSFGFVGGDAMTADVNMDADSPQVPVPETTVLDGDWSNKLAGYEPVKKADPPVSTAPAPASASTATTAESSQRQAARPKEKDPMVGKKASKKAKAIAAAVAVAEASGVEPSTTATAAVVVAEEEDSGPAAFLTYLDTYYTSKASWKFNKKHQTNLLNSCLSVNAVPEEYDDALAAYVNGLVGHNIRDKVHAQAAEGLENATAAAEGRKVEKVDAEAGAGAENSAEAVDSAVVPDPTPAPAALDTADEGRIRERILSSKRRLRQAERDITTPHREGLIDGLARALRADAVLLALAQSAGAQPARPPPKPKAVPAGAEANGNAGHWNEGRRALVEGGGDGWADDGNGWNGGNGGDGKWGRNNNRHQQQQQAGDGNGWNDRSYGGDNNRSYGGQQQQQQQQHRQNYNQNQRQDGGYGGNGGGYDGGYSGNGGYEGGYAGKGGYNEPAPVAKAARQPAVRGKTDAWVDGGRPSAVTGAIPMGGLGMGKKMVFGDDDGARSAPNTTLAAEAGKADGNGKKRTRTRTRKVRTGGGAGSGSGSD